MPDTERRPQDQVPAISRSLLTFFRYIVRGYFRRHFHASALSGTHHLDSLSGPLLVYANHGSWWDPMVAYLLGVEALSRSQALRPHGRRSSPDATPSCASWASSPSRCTPPAEPRSFSAPASRSSDPAASSGSPRRAASPTPRQRPLVFKPGLAALAARMGGGTVLPLAIEYTFWDERPPETLLHFGEPIHLSGQSAEQLEPLLLSALETTMDELRTRVLTRKASAFERTLSFHAAGAGGIYGLAQRLGPSSSAGPSTPSTRPRKPEKP